jgi:hypothetical protein
MRTKSAAAQGATDEAENRHRLRARHPREVELGVIVITHILTTPGVELAGPLPPKLQSFVLCSGAVGSNSKAPQAARKLLQFLTHPASASVFRAQVWSQRFEASRT